MRAPIVSKKHYVQLSLGAVAASAVSANPLIQGVAVADVSSASEVTEGSVVKAIFVEMWCGASSTIRGTVLVSIIKCPDLQTPNFADMIALEDYANKKNVLYHTQGLSSAINAGQTAFFRGWIKIPKGKQRFGLGDTLFLVIASQTETHQTCGFATYKSYT